MNDIIHVSNTPIFDALMRERNIINSLSPNSSLRKLQDPVLKPVLPVRDKGASLHTEEPQKPVMVVAQTDQDTAEILVRPLHQRGGIFAGYVPSAENPHVFTKSIEKVMAEENIHPYDLEKDYEGGLDAWLWDFVKKTMAENPGYTGWATHTKDQFDGTVTVSITAHPQSVDIPAA